MRLYPLLALICAAASTLTAQTFRGEIKGSVEDPSGAILGDTKISAVNIATGFSRATLTGSSGEFSIPDLPPGNYSVSAVKAGFQEQKSQAEVGPLYPRGTPAANGGWSCRGRVRGYSRGGNDRRTFAPSNAGR